MCLVVSGIGVLLMPVAHFVLAFFGFVPNPRHYSGDYWVMQRDTRVEAIVVALTIAVLVAGAGLVGSVSRPRSAWRLAVGAVEVAGGGVFAVVELSVGLPALADAASRVGTVPM